MLHRLRREAHRGRGLDEIVLADGDVGREARSGAPGDDVDGAADRVGAVHRGAAAEQHLDALDVEQRDRDVAVVVPRLRVVEASAVDQHEGLAEAGAADREVGLDAARAALAHLDAGHQPKRVDRRRQRQAGEVFAGQDDDGAPEAAERVGRDGTGDDDGLADVGGAACRRLLRLRRGGRRASDEQARHEAVARPSPSCSDHCGRNVTLSDMRAIRVTAFGGPDVLTLAEVPDPQPGPGQIRVRVHAAGVNPVETYIRSGTYAMQAAAALHAGQRRAPAWSTRSARASPDMRSAIASTPPGR